MTFILKDPAVYFVALISFFVWNVSNADKYRRLDVIEYFEYISRKNLVKYLLTSVLGILATFILLCINYAYVSITAIYIISYIVLFFTGITQYLIISDTSRNMRTINSFEAIEHYIKHKNYQMIDILFNKAYKEYYQPLIWGSLSNINYLYQLKIDVGSLRPLEDEKLYLLIKIKQLFSKPNLPTKIKKLLKQDVKQINYLSKEWKKMSIIEKQMKEREETL